LTSWGCLTPALIEPSTLILDISEVELSALSVAAVSKTQAHCELLTKLLALQSNRMSDEEQFDTVLTKLSFSTLQCSLPRRFMRCCIARSAIDRSESLNDRKVEARRRATASSIPKPCPVSSNRQMQR
jgi:hypothetical protein